MADFAYEDLLPIGADETPYRLLTTEGVRAVEGPGGRTFLEVDPEALRLLTETAMHDIAHYLRPGHLQQLRNILEDPEASNNDKFVALDLLKNANIAAGGVLPMCQDTGTAIVMGKRGQHVLTPGTDEQAISEGVYDAYTRLNLRYSQMAPITTWEEKNTGSNLPAQVEIYADTAAGHEATVQVPLHGQGRRLGQQELPLPGDQGDPQRGRDDALPRREAPLARHGGLPALPPRHRHRRHERRVRPQDSEVRVGEVPRHAAQVGRPGHGSRFQGHRARGEGARADPAVRHRRAVRRQVLLPRRAGRAPPPPRRESACRHCRLVLRRPAGARQDHRRRRLHRAARDRPGALPARCGRCRPRRARGRRRRRQLDQQERRRQGRPHPADGRHPRRAVEAPGQDAALAHRPARRRPRHRARQDQGAPRRRRGDAAVPQGPPGLLRRTRQDPSRYAVRLLRARPPRVAWTPTSTSSRPRVAPR